MHASPVERPVVVAVFDREARAREARAAVTSLGLDDQHVGLLVPGQHVSVSETSPEDVSSLLTQAASATDGNDVGNALLGMGVPDGEARFYAQEARDGRCLVVVHADGRSDEVRRIVLEHGGYDVQSRGRDLIRPGEGGVSGGVGPRPLDVTRNWQDVRSRYEMLWQQHYGTTDATWEQMEPLYRFGWRLANRADLRGQPWTDVAEAVQREWRASRLGQIGSWRDAEGPLQDVWQDVAEEAATGAEGGADRRIPRQGSDQTIAARDLQPPTQGAA
jgi:hypothetical protein